MERTSVKGDEMLEITCVGASGVCVRVVKDCVPIPSVFGRRGTTDEERHTSSIVVDILPSSVSGTTLGLRLTPVPGTLRWTSFRHSSRLRPSSSM
jgi:hypothetical protein